MPDNKHLIFIIRKSKFVILFKVTFFLKIDKYANIGKQLLVKVIY